jgi:hypothetical protein
MSEEKSGDQNRKSIEFFQAEREREREREREST